MNKEEKLCIKLVLKSNNHYAHFMLSTAHFNDNVVTACFNVTHNIQVVIWRQVPSIYYTAAGSRKVKFP
jgi:hypothetical protein